MGFIIWFNWELAPAYITSYGNNSYPLTLSLFAAVPPFVIGIILTVGGYFLLVQRRVGWYISALRLLVLIFNPFAIHLIGESKFFVSFFAMFAPDPQWLGLFGEGFLTAVFIGIILCLVIGRKYVDW